MSSLSNNKHYTVIFPGGCVSLLHMSVFTQKWFFVLGVSILLWTFWGRTMSRNGPDDAYIFDSWLSSCTFKLWNSGVACLS